MDADRCRKIRFQLGQNLLDTLDDGDGVGARLALDVEDDGRRLVHPGGLFGVLDAVHHTGYVVHEHRGAIPVGDHHVVVLAGLGELIVGIDLIILARPVEIAFGGVDAGVGERRAQILHVEAVGGQLDRVSLNAHGRLLPTADAHQADAGDLRDLGREPCIDQVFDLRQRHRIRGDGHGQDRSVGWIGFVVDGRGGQIRGQERSTAVDGLLHFLLGHIDGEREAELQDDDRDASRAGGGHLAEALHFPELTFEGRGDGGRGDVGAGSRIEGQNLDGRVVDFRQSRHGQLRIGNDAHQQNRGHQQRGRNRPENEWARRAHGALLSSEEDGMLALEREMSA